MEKINNHKTVYKDMTKALERIPQSAENHAGQGKKNFNNVDILWPSCLIFAAK